MNILWGSSTNAQQFEGGWDEGGKGVSIADVRNIPELTTAESNFEDFKVASDHYHHMEEDIALLGEMKFSIYRFTISWARIFPNGNDAQPNEEGLQFYDYMLDELEKHNIVPVATLYAYDLPLQLLKKYNGWMSRQCIDDYLRYVETVVKRYKGRIKYYIPFNEQNFLFMDTEYMTGYKVKDARENFMMEHHFNLSYAKATRLIHEIDPVAKVGGNIGCSCFYPLTCNPLDVEATDEVLYRMLYNPADIYFRKTYTKRYLNLVRGYDISEIVLPGDIDVIKSSEADFLSTTYYFSNGMSRQHFDDVKGMGYLKARNPYCASNEWGWSIDPYGLQHFLENLYHQYQLPILILENGLGHRDTIKNEKIYDDYRIKYLAQHIEQLKQAIDNGVEIIGYLTWSAIDLYSTRAGFEKRYGFVHIDKDSALKRRRKKSFFWYKRVIESGGENLSTNIEY